MTDRDRASTALPKFRPRTTWRLRNETLTFGRQPALMGIVNVTPDSFSDGGRFYAQDAAIDHAQQLAADGAALLDIGGESTRPYAQPVPAGEELARVLRVIENVVASTNVPVSIDTAKASVAEAALAAGAQIVNDVTGLLGDPAMTEVVRGSGAGVCVMHMRGTPQTMQDDPQYDDVVTEVQAWLRERRAALIAAGITPERICLDPGIGFGKTHDHSEALMSHCWRLHELEAPLLVGHSRKGFLGRIMGDKEADRTLATAGAAIALAAQGVQIIRVHDVLPVRQALAAYFACAGEK